MHGSLLKKKIKGKVFNMEILIRQELNADFDSVYEVVKAAFLNAEYTDHVEHNLVERLRNIVEYPKEFSH